jgi:hypothetical protein
MAQTTQRARPSAPGAVSDRYLGIAEARQATLQRQAAAYRLAREARRTSGRGWRDHVATLLAALGVTGGFARRSNRCAQVDIARG